MTKFLTQKGVAVPSYSDVSGGTAALPNGSTATTQSASDNSTKVATTAYTDAAVTAGGSTDAFKINGTNVVSPFSITALVNGVGPVGEVEVNGYFAANNRPCMIENTAVNFTSGLRVLATVYQNNTGFPILVMVDAFVTANIAWTAVADFNPSPTTVVCKTISTNATTPTVTTCFFVMPGQFYKVSSASGSPTLTGWREFILQTGTFADSGEISGSRSVNTVFQNTTSKTMFVVAQIATVPAGGSGVTQGISDLNPAPTNVIDDVTQTSSGSATVTVFMIVPNGHYYKVGVASGTISAWHEYTWTVPCRKSNDLALTTGVGTARVGTASSIVVSLGSSTATLVQPATYLNDSGRVRWVHLISTNPTAASFAAFYSSVGTQAIIQNNLFFINQSSSQPRHCYGPVLPGRYYTFLDGTGGGLTMNHWFEYDIG